MQRKPGFSETLYFSSRTGRHLFEAYARHMPIIDYHCHLLPQEIYENRVFDDLGEMWLAHDHYKWRAMRCCGVDERLITGDASFRDKFMAFARILPELAGNPLYIWCALELKRFFDIDAPLSEENAEAVYARSRALIRERRLSPRRCMELSGVRLVCTTEDPIDELPFHALLREDGRFPVRVISAFRPDRAMNCEKTPFRDYLPQLEAAAGMRVSCFADLIGALEKRLTHFQALGSCISDAGLDNFLWREAPEETLDAILHKARSGETLSSTETDQFRTAFLLHMGRVYHRHGFVMQLHIGAYRDANSGMAEMLGPDSGYDCMDSSLDLRSLGRLLDRLSGEGCLPKTILYPLHPGDAEPCAVLAAAFCRGPVRGHVQLGAPWWFNDQAHGIERQFAASSGLYPLGLSLGMLTDSRSFLSYPRHELYRRLLCNYLGTLVERGEYFAGEAQLKRLIQNLCFHNANAFFGFNL
ncbi:MAG: glucuronate isomerase [Clostridia bacterium]|nr:glucuronate isomerase [Clostridia bacterium]